MGTVMASAARQLAGGQNQSVNPAPKVRILRMWVDVKAKTGPASTACAPPGFVGLSLK